MTTQEPVPNAHGLEPVPDGGQPLPAWILEMAQSRGMTPADLQAYWDMMPDDDRLRLQRGRPKPARRGRGSSERREDAHAMRQAREPQRYQRTNAGKLCGHGGGASPAEWQAADRYDD